MNYDDIIDLPHYEPKYHPRMLPYKRASQFMPFAALSGFDELLKQAEKEVAQSFEKKDPPYTIDNIYDD